jgi:Flp pilus assembly protein TadG
MAYLLLESGSYSSPAECGSIYSSFLRSGRSKRIKLRAQPHREENPSRPPRFARGQIFVVFALATATLVAVMGLCSDIGVLYYNWVQLQKAADAAALAGASCLPNDATTATATAQTYATNNGVVASDTITATQLMATRSFRSRYCEQFPTASPEFSV